ncbi:Druantia anti-phage system protein DruA [Desulfofarcimen acetoxidans]|uniref:Druantia anti-phage system protein DruA n=1 Tax=Desulfofarcimen acetoxidans TaxID=58138 RepID=UPI0009FBF4DA
MLPWVKVPHLASHLLARIAKRISNNWICKYGHPILMLETFVEQDRFQGICYRAANWLRVGQTQGLSRHDRNRTLQVPVPPCYQ